MNAANAGFNLFIAETEITDPGNAGTISPSASLAVCNLVSAGAETRTLARPVKQGTLITLHHRTDAGDITLTVTGGFDEAGTTSYTFSDPGQFLTLLSLYDGTSYYWRSISDYNTGSSASGSFTTGTITFVANANMITNATNGTMFATNANQKIGFYGATPVVRPSASAPLVGYNGNGNSNANAVNFNANGNIGSTFYTFGDIVAILKSEGLIAS